MLYIWIPEADGHWLWSTGENWLEAKSIDQLISDLGPYEGQEAVAFFSSHAVQLIQQTITKQQMKQLGSDGIRYLLEEYISLPIDQMRVVHHFSAPDQLTVMGVPQHLVQSLQQSLQLLPVKLVALLPDFFVLPTPDVGECILAQLYGRLLVRETGYKGIAVEDLGLYLSYQTQDLHYRYSQLVDTELEQLFASVSPSQTTHFDYQFQGITRPSQHAFNVLPSTKTKRVLPGYLKAAMYVFLALLIVQFSYDSLRYVQFKRLADQTALQAVNQFKNWFGQSYAVNEQNLQSQFAYQLKKNQPSDTTLLSLLSRIGPILMQQRITAQQLNYENLSLTLELKAASSNDLQNLTTLLNQQGLSAQLERVQAQDSQAVGVLKIQ